MKHFLCPWYHMDEYRLDLISNLDQEWTAFWWYFWMCMGECKQYPPNSQYSINGIFYLNSCTICYQFTTIADSKLDYLIEYLSQCSDIWLVVRILLLKLLIFLFIISIFIGWRWHLFLRAALNIGHWWTLLILPWASNQKLLL